MKSSTTLILLAITVALGAWMLWPHRDGPRDLGGHLLFDWSWSARHDDKEKVQVDVDASRVAGVDLKSSTVEVPLRKTPDGAWELSGSVKDRADAAIVKELLDYLLKARIADVIDHEELDDGRLRAAALGLDDANAWRVSWLEAGGSPLAEIRVGKTAPKDNTCYVQMPGRTSRADVYIVTPDLRPLLARPLDSFRDPRVSRYNPDEVQRMVVRKGEGEVEFSRTSVKEEDAAPWVISKPLPNAPADQPAVKDFVAMICGAKIKGWVPFSDGTGTSTDKPIVEVTLVPPGANEKGITLSFFPDPDAPETTAVCRDPQRRASFKVDKQVMDDLCLAESPNIFRSRKLAAVDPGVISTVVVTTVFGESVEVVRVGNKWSWRPLAGGPWGDAAPEQLERLITRLNEAEILEFTSDSLADPAAFGLDKPAMTITLAAGKHRSLDQLTPMTDKNRQTLRIGIRQHDPPQEGDGQIFANFAGDPFVYRIGPKLPEAIPQSGIKWRSLALPGFSIRQVRGLKQTVGAAPTLELKYNPQSAQWAASRAGEELSGRLNKAAAEALVAKLGALTATAWLQDTADATKALQSPAVSLEVQIEVFDEKPATSHLATVLVELASIPTGQNAPFCYGRLSGVPEPFLIDSGVLREMTVDLLNK